MKIGAQLYNVREFTQDEVSYRKTIKKISAIGYKYAQYSAVSENISAQAIKAINDEYGIDIPLCHVNALTLIENTKKVIEYQKTIGVKYLGIGMLPISKYGLSEEGISAFIRDFNPVAQAIRDAGMKFMYHNHQIEFIKAGGKLIIDALADGFAPNLMGFILDLYWVQVGGGNPAAWIKKFAGRVEAIHLKDMIIYNESDKYAPAQRFAPIYEGNLDWASIFDAANKAGTEYAFVEQDDAYDADPFDCLKISLKNIERNYTNS
ncbi:MAG: sugar phosphate isomerase/epimerase [Clostridiales bacterium]|jgi:sugar phosphate isomerase/epimerase|nr:sugar phosphate isomerase/epimerase [Clostridiales bacterium]